MALFKLFSFSFLMVLSFQTALVLEEKFLTRETNKGSGIKAPEKRANNFRVPMEMPYDPNFWPARGRRSRRDPEKIIQSEKCVNSDANFMCPKISRVQDEETERTELPVNPDDDQMSENEKMEGDRYENVMPFKIMGQPTGRLGMTIFESDLVALRRLNEQRHGKQRHFGLPQFALFENDDYGESKGLYGEKKKKQDVFWVVRGKKNFNFDSPQK